MNILLVIGYVWPEPKSSAAGFHMLSLLRLFKRKSWRVIFATPAKKTEFMCDLANESIETKEIKVNDSEFDSYVSELSPTAVLFDRFLMEEQFGWRVAEHSPSSFRILDTEDLQSLRGARHQALKENRQFCLDDLDSDLAKRELASIYRSDLNLIISEFEMNLLKEKFGLHDELIHHTPFMVEPSELDSSTLSFEERAHFVTIGNLRHAPNWDSILYLQELWPNIKKELPEAELHIYGAYTPPKATALNNPKQGFLIKDRADDVFRVMKNARVCLSPLRFGAGIKGKFIDAMKVSTPCITTSIGSEGMMAKGSWPGYVEDEQDKLVQSAVELYSDKDLWTKMSLRGHSLLKSKYNSRTIGESLYQKVEQGINNLVKLRKKNFIGQMLQHHQMQSTKFMARWIEEKNNKLEK